MLKEENGEGQGKYTVSVKRGTGEVSSKCKERDRGSVKRREDGAYQWESEENTLWRKRGEGTEKVGRWLT